MFSWLTSCQDLLHKATGKEQLKAGNEEEADPGQDHVYKFYEYLSKEQKAQLDEDFDDARVDEMEEAWRQAREAEAEREVLVVSAPSMMNWDLKKPPSLVPGANITNMTDVSDRKVAAWRQAGLEMYFQARVAVVIFSGGMDTRMGDGLPKGALDIGLLSHKSIFQLYVERIRRLEHLAYRKYRRAVHIPVYVMCNHLNRNIIEVFFRENEFFGMREQDLMFFTQGVAPIMDHRGKFLLSEKHRIATYPNGNGGVFRSLMEQGMVSDMKSRGVTSLFMCSIDNLLAKVGDPVFVGLSELCKTEVAIKCIERLMPDEMYGVFCSKTVKKHADMDGDGKLDVIAKVKANVLEFFEISEDLRRRRVQMTNGLPPLQLSAGNLSQYYFKVDFIKRAHALSSKRWHRIPKHCPFVDLTTGELVTPPRRERNAYRMELFVFDSFEHARSVVGLQVERDEMALVKNLQGPDSPSTALQALGKLHQTWIADAGGIFEELRQSSEREDAKCEISPLVTFAGEDLEGQFPDVINLPYYLPSNQETLEFSAASSAQTRRPSTHYLDWYSDLAQRELEVELQGKLGPILEMIEDAGRMQYTGERAEEEEALPPTPRMEDDAFATNTVHRRRGKGKGKGKEQEEDKGSQHSSPRGQGAGQGAGSPRGEDAGAPAGTQDHIKSLASGAPPGTDKSTVARQTEEGKRPPGGGSKRQRAGGAGGYLTLPKQTDGKRDKFWHKDEEVAEENGAVQ